MSITLRDDPFRTQAFKALPPLERLLVIELHWLAKEFGTDEPIVCSADMAAAMCNVKRFLAWQALSGLRKKGFTVLVKRGDRTQYSRGRLASELISPQRLVQGEC